MRRAHLLAALVVVAGCGGTAPEPRPASPEPIGSSAEEHRPAPADEASRADLDRAVALVQAGEPAKARPLLESIVERRPRDPQAAYYLGVALEAGGDAAGAEKRYRDALALAPDLAEAAVNLGALLIDASRWEQATSITRAALAKRPDDAGLHANLALALQGAGDRDGAAAEYAKAVRLAPDDARLRFGQGTLLTELGRKDEAKSALAAALAKAGGDRALVASVAHALARVGAFAECVSGFDRAIAAGDAAELRVERGLCRHGAKDEAGARDDFAAAAKLDPKYAPAQYYLGESLVAAGKRAEAAKAFDAAATLAGDSPLARRAREQAARARKGK